MTASWLVALSMDGRLLPHLHPVSDGRPFSLFGSACRNARSIHLYYFERDCQRPTAGTPHLLQRPITSV